MSQESRQEVAHSKGQQEINDGYLIAKKAFFSQLRVIGHYEAQPKANSLLNLLWPSHTKIALSSSLVGSISGLNNLVVGRKRRPSGILLARGLVAPGNHGEVQPGELGKGADHNFRNAHALYECKCPHRDLRTVVFSCDPIAKKKARLLKELVGPWLKLKGAMLGFCLATFITILTKHTQIFP